jgi:hypothetical protein
MASRGATNISAFMFHDTSCQLQDNKFSGHIERLLHSDNGGSKEKQK